MQNLVTKNQFIYSDRKNTEYKSEEVNQCVHSTQYGNGESKRSVYGV